MNKEKEAIYFKSLILENVRCFGTEQILDLTSGDGKPSRWTLILGENGVGKTSLLQCLAWMRPVPAQGAQSDPTNQSEKDSNQLLPLVKGSLEPALAGEENFVFESLRKGKETELILKAVMVKDQLNQSSANSINEKGKIVKTGISITYNSKGELEDFHLNGNTKIPTVQPYYEPLIIAYSANRQIGRQNLNQSELEDPIATRLSGITELYDPEEILRDFDHAAAKKSYKGPENARLRQLKDLIAKILPDIKSSENIKVFAPNILNFSDKPSGVQFVTYSGEVPLSALSLGYQTTLAWILDLALRMFRNYPKSKTPLEKPAIVLIDEIDLHLHPLWQQTIMDDLSQLFPKVQFIATAHSPLMVQAGPVANLVVVQKDIHEAKIENAPHVVKSWRVDQILTSDLFGVRNVRDIGTEDIFREKYELVNKENLSEAEKHRLHDIDEELMKLDTATDPDDQNAMDIIRRAAAHFKKIGVSDSD